MKACFLREVTKVVIAALLNISLVPLVNALQIEHAQVSTAEATSFDALGAQATGAEEWERNTLRAFLDQEYASTMEHTVPEQFWIDKSQCRYTGENGQIQNPTLTTCQQTISAAKAIAQAEGQKIYTTNQSDDANTGKEVTVYEKAITWTDHGYTIVDSETGAGAYLVEGKENEGWLGSLLLIAGWTLVVFGILALIDPVAVFAGSIFVGKELATALSSIAIGLGLDSIGISWINNHTDNINGRTKLCNAGLRGILIGPLLVLPPIWALFLLIAASWAITYGGISESTCS